MSECLKIRTLMHYLKITKLQNYKITKLQNYKIQKLNIFKHGYQKSHNRRSI